MKLVGKFFVRASIRIPLLIWSVVVIYPIIWMILGSFKNNAEIYADPWGIPETFSFDNFTKAWSEFNIDLSVMNSLIVTVIGIFLTLLMAIPTAYALERIRFKGRTVLFNVY